MATSCNNKFTHLKQVHNVKQGLVHAVKTFHWSSKWYEMWYGKGGTRKEQYMLDEVPYGSENLHDIRDHTPSPSNSMESELRFTG